MKKLILDEIEKFQVDPQPQASSPPALLPVVDLSRDEDDANPFASLHGEDCVVKCEEEDEVRPDMVPSRAQDLKKDYEAAIDAEEGEAKPGVVPGEPRAQDLISFVLTEDNEEAVREAMKGVPKKELRAVVAVCFGEDIMRMSMRSLRHGQWLNDQIINGLMKCLAHRDEWISTRDGIGRSHFFSTFFMLVMFQTKHNDSNHRNKYNYAAVSRWSKKVPGGDIFALKNIFFPINKHNMHWMLAVVSVQEKRVAFYDSLGGDGGVYLKGIKQYLQDEHKRQHGVPMDMSGWRFENAPTPRQGNGSDCGVFVSMIADFLSRGLPLDFDQSHIDHCRDRIALSLLRGCVV